MHVFVWCFCLLSPTQSNPIVFQYRIAPIYTRTNYTLPFKIQVIKGQQPFCFCGQPILVSSFSSPGKHIFLDKDSIDGHVLKNKTIVARGKKLTKFDEYCCCCCCCCSIIGLSHIYFIFALLFCYCSSFC